MESKKQKLDDLRAEADKLRRKRHGLYADWSKTDCYKDYMGQLKKLEESYLHSAKTGVGLVNGSTVALTSEQRTSLLDQAQGMTIARLIIENNLS